jgi:hypothetical protein
MYREKAETIPTLAPSREDCPPLPLALTDWQLSLIIEKAYPLRPVDRAAYLAKVAQLLQQQPEAGDGSVYRAVATAQRTFFDPPLDSHVHHGGRQNKYA